jgi:hypothetical protein
MSSSPSDPSDELQFQTVEPVHPGVSLTSGRSCVVCKRPIQSMYFAVRDKTLCPDCARMVQAGPPQISAAGLAQALVMGVGAGLVGTVVWYAIRKILHLQIGLVAVLLGYMIGKAVRKGSRGRGGPVFQAIAIFLTYSSIAASYMPDELAKQTYPDSVWHASGADYLNAGLISIQQPISRGEANPIGLLIIGFALWEAWKFTRFYPIPLTGPYQVAPAAAPPPLPSSTGQASDSEVII